MYIFWRQKTKYCNRRKKSLFGICATEIQFEEDKLELQANRVAFVYEYLIYMCGYTPFSIAAFGPQNSIVSFKNMLGKQWYSRFLLITCIG